MSLFKKSETEKKVDAFIEKHTGKLTAAVIIGLSIWGLSSCMEEATPEEKQAATVNSYLDHCKRHGRWFEVHELGGAQKYKDYSLVSYFETQKLLKANPELDQNLCRVKFEEGVTEGRKLVRERRVDMKGE